MITLAIPIKHICANPALFRSAWNLEIGSLWQCNECGREQMLVSKDGAGEFGWDKWRYTVEIVDKPVQKARGRKNANVSI